MFLFVGAYWPRRRRAAPRRGAQEDASRRRGFILGVAARTAVTTTRCAPSWQEGEPSAGPALAAAALQRVSRHAPHPRPLPARPIDTVHPWGRRGPMDIYTLAWTSASSTTTRRPLFKSVRHSVVVDAHRHDSVHCSRSSPLLPARAHLHLHARAAAAACRSPSAWRCTERLGPAWPRGPGPAGATHKAVFKTRSE